jgi:hypothetical protein
MRETQPTFSNSGNNGRISCNILNNTVLYEKTQPVGTPLLYIFTFIHTSSWWLPSKTTKWKALYAVINFLINDRWQYFCTIRGVEGNWFAKKKPSELPVGRSLQAEWFLHVGHWLIQKVCWRPVVVNRRFSCLVFYQAVRRGGTR